MEKFGKNVLWEKEINVIFVANIVPGNCINKYNSCLIFLPPIYSHTLIYNH